jgi:hypothetical protein
MLRQLIGGQMTAGCCSASGEQVESAAKRKMRQFQSATAIFPRSIERGLL